jgi:hypothetical protein
MVPTASVTRSTVSGGQVVSKDDAIPNFLFKFFVRKPEAVRTSPLETLIPLKLGFLWESSVLCGPIRENEGSSR